MTLLTMGWAQNVAAVDQWTTASFEKLTRQVAFGQRRKFYSGRQLCRGLPGPTGSVGPRLPPVALFKPTPSTPRPILNQPVLGTAFHNAAAFWKAWGLASSVMENLYKTLRLNPCHAETRVALALWRRPLVSKNVGWFCAANGKQLMEATQLEPQTIVHMVELVAQGKKEGAREQ